MSAPLLTAVAEGALGVLRARGGLTGPPTDPTVLERVLLLCERSGVDEGLTTLRTALFAAMKEERTAIFSRSKGALAGSPLRHALFADVFAMHSRINALVNSDARFHQPQQRRSA
jgi:hypothetical protein